MFQIADGFSVQNPTDYPAGTEFLTGRTSSVFGTVGIPFSTHASHLSSELKSHSQFQIQTMSVEK